MSVVVEAGSRIHIALIDLARATDHAYGGVGFGIATPLTTIEAERSFGMSFSGADI